MTDKLLRIAVFEPIDSNAAQIQKLFTNKSRFDVHYVRSSDQAAQISERDGDIFDAIVVPSLLSDRTPSATACLQIKSNEQTSALPVVVLSWVKDSAAIASLYSAGADIVLIAPFEGELVYKQLTALRRLTRAFKEELDANLKDKGLRQALVAALHFIDDAIIVLDSERRMVFANRALRELLRVYDAAGGSAANEVFAPLVQAVTEGLREGAGFKSKVLQAVLKRADEGLFSAELRIMPLRAPDDSLVAYCATVYDLTAPRELSSNLMQIERLNSLALLLAASCHQLLNAPSLGEPGRSLAKIESLLKNQQERAGLLPVATAVLEFLDLILSSRTSLKFDLKRDHSIAMRPADLYQLIGHLVLHSVAYVGHNGESRVRSEDAERSGYITLSITASGDPQLLSTQERQAASVVRAKLFGTDRSKQDRLTKTVSFGIAVAQDITRAYALNIREERKSIHELKLSVDLPLIVV